MIPSILMVIVISSWLVPGFAELDPGLGGVREQDQFLMVSRQTDGSLIDLALEHACSISVIGWSRSWAECLLPWLHGEIAVPCANVC